TLSQKVPGQFKAGESFKDYLNLAIASEFNQAEKYYALYGDPSNIVRTDGNFFKPLRRVNLKLEGEEIRLEMPKIEVNDFFFLGRNHGPFTEKEIESIKEGKFEVADATIIEKDPPFVTNAVKNLDKTRYDIILDKNLESEIGNSEDIIWGSELTDSKKLQVMTTPEPTRVTHNFNLSDYKRIYLEATQKDAGFIEVLEAPIESTNTAEQEIGGKKYAVDTFILRNTGRHPYFLDSEGTIKFTKNKNNEVQILVELTGLEKTNSISTSEAKLLFFDSYKLFFENTQTQEKKLINTIESEVKKSGQASFGLFPFDVDLSKYDKATLYGTPSIRQNFDFVQKPILTAKIHDESNNPILGKEIAFENTYGFLQYSFAEVELKMFTPKESASNGNLLQITRLENLKPLKENKVILLETTADSTTKSKINQSITDTVKKIIEENGLQEKFPNPENVLLLDGEWVKGFFGHFVEGAYFFGNRITASPFRYPQNVDFESVKNAFEDADFSNEKSEDKVFKAQIGENSLDVDADIYFSTADEKFTDNDVRFYFQLGLEDLFALMEKGAWEKNYDLIFDGFEGGFERIQTAEPPPIEDVEDGVEEFTPQITIQRIEIGGGTDFKNGDTVDILGEDGKKPITVSFTVNTDFEHIILLGNDILLDERYPTELSEFYSTGDILILSSSANEYVAEDIAYNKQIKIALRVYGKNAQEFNSEPVILKTTGELT
ncbi:MAG: hypothetical protein AAB558_02745, partial [Patescibacteria group bacterium]